MKKIKIISAFIALKFSSYLSSMKIECRVYNTRNKCMNADFRDNSNPPVFH